MSVSSEDARHAVLKAANLSLDEQYSFVRNGDYEQVHVLLLRWESTDLDGLVEEEASLAQLFTGDFNYAVERFPIPLEQSHVELVARLAQFMLKLGKKKPSLGVLYYGGHGDPNFDKDKGEVDQISVWASHKHDGSTLCWSDIQPGLAKADADILLLLDCCFASQAARGSGELVIPANVEILAACAKGLQTPGPLSPQSFTRAMIEEMRRALQRENGGLFTFREIHQRLTSRSRGLMQTPVYFPRERGYVRLAPLRSLSPREMSEFQQKQGSIDLRMVARGSISEDLLSEVVSWLKRNPPPGIGQVRITKLTNQTLKIQELINHGDMAQSQDSPVSMNRLIEPARENLRGAWSRFTANLQSALSALAGHEIEGNERAMNKFVKNFETNTDALQRVVEKEFLVAPEFQNADSLRMGIEQQESRILGLADAFRVRLLNLTSVKEISAMDLGKISDVPSTLVKTNPDPPDTLSIEKHPQWDTDILVEWKVFEDPSARDDDIVRIHCLIAVLRAASAGHFRTPACLGCLMPTSKASLRYGLVFRAPQENQPPITLYTLLRQQQDSSRRIAIPTLGERFRLAYEVAQAVMRWHAAGWLHQGLASFHIVFFEQSVDAVAFGSPYLMGFDYSREDDASSARRRNDQPKAEAIRDLYRHPERQGSKPRKKHQRRHDLYALGLILLEIGRWALIEDIFQNVIRRRDGTGGPYAVKSVAMKFTDRVLSHNMGTAYTSATAACLSGDLGVKEDDAQGSKFLAHFEAQIVRKLETGLMLE
jgi:hypothetical protein